MEKKEINKIKTEKFLELFSESKEPIEVNFRELVSDIKFQDRANHLIHTYPAKLLPNIPYFFINNNYFTSLKDVILDPFCGSGTVLLEAQLAGMRAFGSDANPLARLISKVKTDNYNISSLENLRNILEIEFKNDSGEFYTYPDVVNLDYWFLPHIKQQLNIISHKINSIESKKYRDFFLVCFSNCIKKVSLADSRISVPVRIKIDNYPNGHKLREKNRKKLDELESIDVFKKFLDIVDVNIKRTLSKKIVNSNRTIGRICSADARSLKLPNDSVDLIITSPPYAGAQKYIRASSLNLGWTELAKVKDLKILDNKNIGRENYNKFEYRELKKTGITDADTILEEIYSKNPLRAHIAANYLIEMKSAIKESVRVLKPKKHMIIVAANNQVCGVEFKTQEYLMKLAESMGLTVICRLIDDIKSYGLMTKRNKTASIITCEWVLVLKK